MFHVSDLARRLPLGLAYFIVASLTVSLTRFGGGVAFMWVAGPILIADLMARPRRQWGPSLLVCGVASALATGLFGLGWVAALPFVAINLIEAALAAWLFRRQGPALRPLGSLSWLMQFVIAVGIVAPLVAGTLAAVTLALLGKSPDAAFTQFVAGHALGNITLTPLAVMLARGTLQQAIRDRRTRDNAETASLLLAVAVTSALVFFQGGLPLLFLPILPIMLVTFRAGRGGAAMAIVLLALIGGVATLSGFGPTQLIDASMGWRVHFFQLYLAATVLTVLPVAADLQHRSRLHRALRVSEERYRLMAEHSTDILLHLEVDGRIRYVSPSVRQLGGYDPGALVGLNCGILIAPEYLDQVRQRHYATVTGSGQTQTYDYLALTKTGEKRWFETHSRAVIDDDGNVDGVLNIVRDINERKAIEHQLAEAAMTDSLTGLANRRGFKAAVLGRKPAPAGAVGDTIAVLDIDHFKRVNDQFGHDAGDEVLKSFAEVASRMMRLGDLVARIGGEEFAVLLPRTSVDQAREVCERLRAEMAGTATIIDQGVVVVTISGGVAPLGPEGLDQAFKVADAALYRAKRNGRDQLAIAA